MSTNLDWVTDANRALIASRSTPDDLKELARRYDKLAFDCRDAVWNIERESTKLNVIDKALRESQRGWRPGIMAEAVFAALNLDPGAELADAVRRIINRNLMDTNFNRMAEEVAAAVEGAA